MARFSGLQREVLALYRTCLRESRKKPVVSYCVDENLNLEVVVDVMNEGFEETF